MAAQKKNMTAGKIPQKVRMLDGQKVGITLYDGPRGKYMASTLNGELLIGKSGKPLEFKNTGKLEWV